MTGWAWTAEQGLLASPICITDTYSVGVVRDAICALAVREKVPMPWLLPVVAETYDGWLSDASSFPVTTEHAIAALDAAASGSIAEGNVGGGTGMICHEFKGGTGTASRAVETAGETFTVGALVQANYGARELLRVDGVPIGREIGTDIVSSPRSATRDGGSIIVILGTDAPLRHDGPGLGRWYRLQRQRRHLPGIRHRQSHPSWRPGQSVSHVVTRQHEPPIPGSGRGNGRSHSECSNCGRDNDRLRGHTAHALPLDRLVEAMQRQRP
jgi:hypothetical protein